MARYSSKSSIGGGRFWIKTMGGIEVPADGEPYTVFAKAIPPYIAVNRAWVHIWMTGKTSSGLHDKQQMLISGQFSNLHADTDGGDPATGNATGDGGSSGQTGLNGFVDRHQPIASGDQNLFDIDADEEVAGMGITSYNPDKSEASQMSIMAQEREFVGHGKPYKCQFGLGHNAFLDGAASLRYAKEYVKNDFGVGNPSLDIKQWRLISLRGWTDTLQNIEDDDWHKMVFGADSPDMSSLANEANRLFGEQGQSPWWSGSDAAQNFTPNELGTGVGEVDNFLTNSVYPWMTSSWGTSASTSGGTLGGSGLDSDVVMMLQAKVTLECAVVKPTPMNIYTPDG